MMGEQLSMDDLVNLIMKIIILTTDTPHHFFVKKIASLFNISAIVLEEKFLVQTLKHSIILKN